MKKGVKQHLIYASVAFVILIGLVGVIYYEHQQIVETRNLLAKEVNELNNEIKGLKSKDSILEMNLEKIVGNISELSMGLKERATEIKSLTGDLMQVRIESEKKVEELQDNIKSLKAQNQDFSDVIEEAVPSVVSIRTDVGSGSGFIINSNGFTVTNYHVIEGATAGVAVTSDGESHAVRVVGYDINADVAVLDLKGEMFPRLGFGNSRTVDIGEKVIAVGSPGGLDFTVTQGIVSAQREDSYGNELIQIDVPINPGNSGGPLINAEGEVIGMNTKKIAGFEGVGFALASNYVNDIVDDIISNDVSE